MQNFIKGFMNVMASETLGELTAVFLITCIVGAIVVFIIYHLEN